jgi:Abnormal spindle-like microcephaly-assoc'd, ASPM-SPD-2-Hydin
VIGHRLHHRLATSLLIALSVVSLATAAVARGRGDIGVRNYDVTFGDVPIGKSKSVPDSIVNHTSSQVTISSIQVSNPSFKVTGITLPLVLASEQRNEFEIQFSPSEASGSSARISFLDQDGQPFVSLSASGTGSTTGAVVPGTLVPNPSPLAFGNTKVGANQTSSVTLTNSGGADLTITQATLSGAGFAMGNLSLPMTLPAGNSTSTTITFAPTASGNFSGSVTFATASTGAQNTAMLQMTGSGTAVPATSSLAANPSSLSFGSIQVSSSANLSETLTNSGASPVTISQANVAGAGFSISGLSVPLTLAANQSVTFNAIFAPTSGGKASGTLSIVSSASNSTLSVAFSGTGAAAGQLGLSPASLSFGNVAVGSTASLNGTITASGSPVNITSAGINNSEFVVSGISLPVTLAAGQSASFAVTFTPQSSGATSASLSFASNAANSPPVESMTGTGTATTQHTVDLSWNGSTGAVGYNIYRGTTAGGPYSMVNPSLNDSTAYTDNTVVSGQTYYYVATAVDDQSQESGYSNETQAVIPNP